MRVFQYLSQWKSKAKDGIQQSLLVAKFLCLLHVTNNYICSPVMVYGPSMLPTLNLTGDVLLAEHLSPLLDKLGPGDVVLVRSPDNPRKTVTKRIVGMEGDTVTFLADPARSDRYVTLKVPKGHVWIQGDNIYASKDSRQLGPIPYGLILGKVLCRVWPPEGFGSL
ncbi:PREDICTED: mitochondrial inner membrane protease subunit 1 [Nicotiana attenuata]|uniref:Thylakoidal processing peptidase 2, chloroplastic n=1 Tax=Nicotiana attenuata TaxID=49451 RepID=A0A314L0G9_NICAT|nr:PREDICTED: mitochondrial inner membrane protease subunit 1 [Nicotiana attenuata]OIT35043.1 putative thylakoidal processing peptidase 2, chloroplastic [Nicotiana attenuata]